MYIYKGAPSRSESHRTGWANGGKEYGAMDSLMTHLNLNSGSYSGAFGLNFESDGVTPRPDRFNFRMVLNNVNPSNPLYPSTIPSAPGVWPADDPDAINSTSFDSYEEYFLSTVTSALNQAGSEFAVKGELKSGPITDDPYLDIINGKYHSELTSDVTIPSHIRKIFSKK